MPFRKIAEAISRQLGLPSRSIAPDEAEVHFGGIAMFASGNGPVSSDRTRQALGGNRARSTSSRISTDQTTPPEVVEQPLI